MQEISKAFALVILGGLIVLTLDHAAGQRDDLEDQRREYCEMVELYRTSQGELGWPDYRNIYSEQCK